MSAIKLSSVSLKQTTDTVSGDLKIKNKWQALSDSYRGDGVTAAMLETVKKGGDEDLRQQVSAAIVLAFTEKERKLLAADTKTLSDSDKGNKKTLQQRVGSYLDKIRTHIANAEKIEDGEDGEGSAPKTEVQRIQALLEKVVTKLQKLEKPAFDVTEAVKRVNAIKGMMPAL